MPVKMRREGGWTYLELTITMLIIVILILVVTLILTGAFSGTRERVLEADLRMMKTAVDTFNVQSGGEWPTADGRLPEEEGSYTPIDFYASFTKDDDTFIFYPHFLAELPQHHDEGVWRLDYAALVSINIAPEDY